MNPATAKRDYVSRTVRGSHRDAEVELTKLLRQVDEGAIAPRAGTVGELVESWYRLREPDLSPPVVLNYRAIIDRHILPRWGNISLRRLRVADLDQWYATLRISGGARGQALSANSVRRVHAILHAALQQGVRWGLTTSNPADAASPPTIRRQQVTLTAKANDFARIIAKAAEVNRALPVFIRLALATGARRGELCALRWRDVDLGRGMIRISRTLVQSRDAVVEKDTKTHQIRNVSFDRTTGEVLAEYRDQVERACAEAEGELPDEAFVFSHEIDGQVPWRPNYVTLAFCRIRDDLGLTELRLHDLRHASASLMLANGIDVKTVSGRLGHAQTSTTLDVYAHMMDQADERAAESLGAALDGYSTSTGTWEVRESTAKVVQ